MLNHRILMYIYRFKPKKIIEKLKNGKMIKDKIMTINDVKKILSNVNFSKYSCLDMDYQFQVNLSAENLFLIRASFVRKDIESGKIERGWGRWHTTPVNTATETSIVMTAYVCVKMIVEHELLEGFEYLGEKLFNPHKNIDELVFPKKINRK